MVDVHRYQQLEHVKTKERRTLQASGLFFAIGHDPATAFLNSQLQLDKDVCHCFSITSSFEFLFVMILL